MVSIISISSSLSRIVSIIIRSIIISSGSSSISIISISSGVCISSSSSSSMRGSRSIVLLLV